MTDQQKKEGRDLCVAWVQLAFCRSLVEIVSVPRWSVVGAYLKNWKHPRWEVQVVHPDPDTQPGYCGDHWYDVRDLHPMTSAARELLRVREDRPRSPFITPELP